VLLVTSAFFLVGTSFFSYTSLYATYLHNQLGFSVSDVGTSLGMYGVVGSGSLVTLDPGATKREIARSFPVRPWALSQARGA
jgi:predicted MFS family arabinose efflux permease